MAESSSLPPALASLLGPAGLLTEPTDLAPALADWRSLYQGRALALLRPANTAELAEAVRLCSAAGIAIVPQGGNTSMVGGATPDASGRNVIVSLARMNRIRDLDPLDMTMTAEAGVVVKTAQEAAAAAGCPTPDASEAAVSRARRAAASAASRAAPSAASSAAPAPAGAAAGASPRALVERCAAREKASRG